MPLLLPLADIQNLPLFIGAGLLLNLTPGVDMALVVRHSAASGFRAGATAALGVGAGCWVHTLATALGLAAVLAESPAAFTALRWAGALYLVWMGWGLLRSRPAATAGTPSTKPTPALRGLFWQGFLTNVLNPKVAFFFLAFVPQFITPGAVRPAGAFVLLGTVFVVNGTLVNAAIAGATALVGQRLSRRPAAWRLGHWLDRGVGALFVALGMKLVFDASTA